MIIYQFAVTSIGYFYIPIFIAFYIIALYLLREKPIIYYFVSDVENAKTPTRILYCLDVFELEDRIMLTPTKWIEVFKRKKQLIIQGEDFWYFSILNTNNKLFYFNKLEYDEQGNLIVELGDIHKLDVEKFLTDLKHMNVISDLARKMEKKATDLEVNLEKLALEKARTHIDKFVKAVDEGIRG